MEKVYCPIYNGDVRASANYAGHRGEDLVGIQSKILYPCRNGVVVRSEFGTGANKSYGNFVKIKHYDGTHELLAHMRERYVQVGDTVTQATEIGYEGTTGNVTGSHVHVEYQDAKGNLLDPSIITGVPMNKTKNSITYKNEYVRNMGETIMYKMRIYRRDGWLSIEEFYKLKEEAPDTIIGYVREDGMINVYSSKLASESLDIIKQNIKEGDLI